MISPMSTTGYFLITRNPIQIEGPLSWEELQRRILPDPENEGHTPARDGFFECVPDQDQGYFESINGKRIDHDQECRVLVIKGEIVVPKPATVVTKFEEPT
jgi:hypothetical protein